MNHSGCSVTHGWSGAHCSARSSATSMPSSLRARHERVEVGERAQLRVDRVVPALGRADGPRRADVLGHRDHAVVRALAVDRPDRVNRRQVDHVEAHAGDPVEFFRGGLERAVHRLARLVHAAGRAREQLVPGAVQRARAVDPQLVLAAAGDQVADRVGEHVPLDRLGQRLGDPRGQRQRGVAQRGRPRRPASSSRRCAGSAAPPGPAAARRTPGRWPAPSGLCAAPTLTSTACRQVAHGSLHASTR